MDHVFSVISHFTKALLNWAQVQAREGGTHRLAQWGRGLVCSSRRWASGVRPYEVTQRHTRAGPCGGTPAARRGGTVTHRPADTSLGRCVRELQDASAARGLQEAIREAGRRSRFQTRLVVALAGLTPNAPPAPAPAVSPHYWVSEKSRSGQAIWEVLRSGEVGMAGRCAYPSDLADGEWAVLAPLVPPPKPGGRSPTHSPRDLINALAYWLRAGCAWRLLPQDFPTVADGVPLRADMADRRPLGRDSRRPACPRTHRSGA